MAEIIKNEMYPKIRAVRYLKEMLFYFSGKFITQFQVVLKSLGQFVSIEMCSRIEALDWDRLTLTLY